MTHPGLTHGHVPVVSRQVSDTSDISDASRTVAWARSCRVRWCLWKASADAFSFVPFYKMRKICLSSVFSQNNKVQTFNEIHTMDVEMSGAANTADIVTLNHLGPHDVANVDDGILGVVHWEGIPVVVKQQLVNGATAHAVLARKDIEIACIGCFRRDMRVSDPTRCKKCASFVKHWDAKDGVRRLLCEGDADEMEDDHVGHAIVEAKAEDSVLEELTDEELLDAVKARGLGSHVVEAMSDEKLADAMRVRGIKPLVDARPSGLIHELCCQGLDKNCTAEECHHEDKVGDLSHSNDAVGAHVKIIHGSDVGLKTRQAKRQKKKAVIESFEFVPEAVGNCDVRIVRKQESGTLSERQDFVRKQKSGNIKFFPKVGKLESWNLRIVWAQDCLLLRD